MLLYHGSNTFNIKKLEPRQADHDRPYIYLTTIKIIAAFYLCNAVEKPYYWFPYGFDKNGKVQYHELYPNALKEVSVGKSGCIYTVNVSEDDIMPLKNISCARLGVSDMIPVECMEISNCFEWLTEQEKQNLFVLKRFEDKSKDELDKWYSKIQQYITDKNMINTPDCSYAKFIRTKFPQVWSSYEHCCKKCE